MSDSLITLPPNSCKFDYHCSAIIITYYDMLSCTLVQMYLLNHILPVCKGLMSFTATVDECMVAMTAADMTLCDEQPRLRD